MQLSYTMPTLELNPNLNCNLINQKENFRLQKKKEKLQGKQLLYELSSPLHLSQAWP